MFRRGSEAKASWKSVVLMEGSTPPMTRVCCVEFCLGLGVELVVGETYALYVAVGPNVAGVMDAVKSCRSARVLNTSVVIRVLAA